MCERIVEGRNPDGDVQDSLPHMYRCLNTFWSVAESAKINNQPDSVGDSQ